MASQAQFPANSAWLSIIGKGDGRKASQMPRLDYGESKTENIPFKEEYAPQSSRIESAFSFLLLALR